MVLNFCSNFILCGGRAIEEIGLKAMEHSSILVSVLLLFLRDGDSIIAKQSIVSGTNFFCSVLEELALQVTLLLSLSSYLYIEKYMVIFFVLYFMHILKICLGSFVVIKSIFCFKL